jgi:type I restriction enzyme S subunit
MKEWPLKAIGEFCKTGSGGTPSRKQESKYYGGTIPWVKSGELRESVIFETEESITEAALSETSTKMIPAGALLVAMYGATVGRIATLGISASSNQAVCHIVPDDSIADQRYMFYALSRQVPKWLNQRVGGAQPNISQQIIRNTKVPLPPIAEQRRIAAILDKADAIRRKRKQAIQYTEELLRATFLDMFGDPVTNPKGWEILPIESLAATQKNSLAIGPFGSALKVDDYREEGHPVVFVRDVRENQFNWTSEVFVDDRKFEELRSHRVYPGDVVATKMGTPPCIAAVYPDNMAVGVVTADIIKVTPNPEKATPLYISSAINSDFCKSQVTRFTEGITRPKVTLRDFKNLQVPCPPLASQHQWDLFFGPFKELWKAEADA